MTKEKKLDEYLRRLFPSCFAETNIHPIPVEIVHKNKNGVETAAVTLRWQIKPDYKVSEHAAYFSYKDRIVGTVREYYWYCTSGLPND